MAKIKETVIVHVPVEIEYDNRKGARDALIEDLRRMGPTTMFGAGPNGGYRTKALPVSHIAEKREG